jgi:hypothetical protein
MDSRQGRTSRRSPLRALVGVVLADMFDEVRGSFEYSQARIASSLARLAALGVVAMALLLAIGYQSLRLPVVGRYLERLLG